MGHSSTEYVTTEYVVLFIHNPDSGLTILFDIYTVFNKLFGDIRSSINIIVPKNRSWPQV